MITMSDEKLKPMLKLRKAIKDKKPTFVRQDSHKKGRIKPNWRKPKGLQSKMRLQKKGYRRIVKIGWKSPSMVRGLSREGFREVLVNNVNEIKKLDAKTEIAIIAAKVGMKKRVDMLKAAIEAKIKVENVEDPAEYIKEVEKEMQERKAEKKKGQSEKEKKSKEKEKLAKKREEEKQKEEESKGSKEKSIDELVAEDKEKKAKEKKEKDKILISKE